MFINNFDPVAFQIFSLEIRWYSLAYIIGITLGLLYFKKEINKKKEKGKINKKIRKFKKKNNQI